MENEKKNKNGKKIPKKGLDPLLCFVRVWDLVRVSLWFLHTKTENRGAIHPSPITAAPCRFSWRLKSWGATIHGWLLWMAALVGKIGFVCRLYQPQHKHWYLKHLQKSRTKQRSPSIVAPRLCWWTWCAFWPIPPVHTDCSQHGTSPGHVVPKLHQNSEKHPQVFKGENSLSWSANVIFFMALWNPQITDNQAATFWWDWICAWSCPSSSCSTTASLISGIPSGPNKTPSATGGSGVTGATGATFALGASVWMDSRKKT